LGLYFYHTYPYYCDLVIAHAPTASDPEFLRQELGREQAKNRWLELRVKDLETQLYGQKSERRGGLEPDDNLTWDELLKEAQTLAPASEPAPVATPPISHKTGLRRGPKPLDPALPREVIAVPSPDLKALICPVTKRPMQPAFVDVLEVLARRPAVYFVQRYERTVFTSPAKTAPVYAPWPADVLPRSRVHASIVAHIAAAHFCEHAPYNRLEKQLQRIGVDLPRVCQVSLMAQLDERVQPLVAALQAQVWQSGYIHLDATPIDLKDPGRPGAVRESTLWAYRANDGPVWFDFRLHKSPTSPAKLLEQYRGLLQTDGASGLEKIGQEDRRVTHLGCFSHARRYLVKAVDAGETNAVPYMTAINQLFRLERLARHFKLTQEQRAELRRRRSRPVADKLFADAQTEISRVPPKTRLGQALGYLLGQQASLLRCLTESRARIENNLVEQSIRPLKLGARNWGHIGHPNAGPRLANLFTLVENCRREGIDPEGYLVDIIGRILDHPMKRIAELLPRQWQAARSALSAAAVVV
jgi:transposase